MDTLIPLLNLATLSHPFGCIAVSSKGSDQIVVFSHVPSRNAPRVVQPTVQSLQSWYNINNCASRAFFLLYSTVRYSDALLFNMALQV